MSDGYLPVRLSHLLRHCSVGAVVRGPDLMVTVKDIRNWNKRDGNPAGDVIRYVDQVRAALGIEQVLRTPPTAKEKDRGPPDGESIPATRFPTWMRCPSCGLMYHKPWKELEPGENPRCRNEGGSNGEDQCERMPELEQVSWVMAHTDGHLADVPWHRHAHEKARGREQEQCSADWETPYLRLIDRSGSPRKIFCGRCKANNDFPDALRIFFSNTWRQPWINEAPDPSDEPAVVLEVNDARVHSPVTRSALVIPPESRIRKGTVVDRLYSSSQKLQQINNSRTPLARRGALQLIAGEFRCSVDDLEDALDIIERGYPLFGENITQGILLELEYGALIEEIPDVADDEDFVTRHYTRAWRRMTPSSNLPGIIGSIDHLIAVNRLKEILVFEGFQRLGGELVPPDILGISDWLPALELYGEGIFFTLNEEAVEKWEAEEAVRERAEAVNRRFAAANLHFDAEVVPSPRFLLLHTFAHLLMRQLEQEAGYPSAALKERIYCSTSETPMSGILIYVAVPDVVGSLGGLVELAEPDRFLPLLSRAFESAERCSLDPVCSEQEGQGPHLLNRAACHACALVPEPSCAFGNVLLDRTFVKGDTATGATAFLDYIS